MQQQRHYASAVSFQGVLSITDTPVIKQSPLAEGVQFCDLVGRHFRSQLPLFLSFGHNFIKKTVIQTVLIQQMLFPSGDQLGRVQRGQQFPRHTGLNHTKKLLVEINQFLKTVLIRLKFCQKLFIFIIKKVRKRT